MDDLNYRITECDRCPRLVAWRESVAREKRKSFADEPYWGKPVPNFGDQKATGLIVGLAPAAHGANRTGRMFTGDRSGDWLYWGLHEVGLANQPTSVNAHDGLALNRVLVTAVCHCAPPANKPERSEIESCRTFLLETLATNKFRAILCLGGLAWSETARCLNTKFPVRFCHGATFSLGSTEIYASYHPSQQNTFTGKLTRDMFLHVLSQFARTVLR